MIYGRVLDPQSSAVASAAITVTNVETNTLVSLRTNETGYYEANLLLPGSYQVTAGAPGFKKYIRGPLTLTVSTRLEINIAMELGAVAETVSVTAEAPILDTSTVSSGRVVDNRTLMDLPVLGNSPILLVKLTPGIQVPGTNNYLGLHSNAGGSEYSTAGSVGGNEWSIDGVPNNGPGRRVAYLPYSDTLQEFKVETSNFDASIGHTTGVSVAMMSKAGTNAIHGTLTEQHWQQRWNGTPFFVKQLYYRNIAAAEASGNTALANQLRSKDKQETGRSNNYAATFGGPVIIPKVFNGKDRLFFFFSWNGFKDVKTEDPNSINRTIPTVANRGGDFSQLLEVDPVRYQLHDPLSVRRDPARPNNFIRTPIPGNIVPAARILNPAYNAYVKLLPVPNNDPASPRQEPRNNYLAVATPYNWDYKAYHNRIDYNHSERHRFFGRWSWNDFLEDRGDWTYESARGLHSNGLNRHNLGGTLDWVWTRSAATVFDFAVAANEFREGDKITVPLQFKPSDLGFPAYIDQKAGDRHILPLLDFDTYQDIGRGGVPTFTRYRLLTAKAEMSHVRGNHSIRTGADLRGHFRTGGGGGNTSGNYRLGNNYTRRNDDTLTPAGDFGHQWAAFMMGFPNGMTIATTDSYATFSPYYAGFIQDNWRLTRKLSLNLGLRLEYEVGPTERYNRFLANYDPTAKLPITDAAQAAYARNPVAERPASEFVVLGGSTFPSAGRRRLFQNELMWLPRAAAAYQVNSKTVLRGGYGTFFDTLNVLINGPNLSGFSRTTSTTISTDFGVNWLVADPPNGRPPITDPFPVRASGTRFDVPTRDELGLMHVAGRGFDYTAYDSRHARQHRWRVGVQRQLSTNMVVEAAYAGSYSDRVYIDDVRYSILPERYWASGLVRNDAVASYLNANITNPFNISNFAALRTSHPLVYQDMLTNGFFTSSTIRRDRLLRAFPHMTDVRQDVAPVGTVRTDALELTFERRFSKGFSMNAGYTRFRVIDADIFLNEFDPKPTERPSNDGRPHRFIATTIYELPFGKGRALVSQGWASHLLGGWQIGVTYEWQPGPLIGFGNNFYYGKLEDINTGPVSLDRWFNTDNFERNSTRSPNSFHRRIFPTRIDDLRRDMTNQWNANVQRDFRIRERVTFQIRMDAINVMNRSQFSDPDTNPLSTNFGKIVSQTNATNRWIQLQGRIRF